jgi:hypothetical protein
MVAVVVRLSLRSVLDVFEALEAHKGIPAAIHSAQHSILVGAVVLGFIGIAWGLVDRRVEVPAHYLRAIGAVTILLAGVVFFAKRYGDPIAQASLWWDKFKADDYVSDPATPHLISGVGGAGRYDIWKVALEVFRHHPLVGIGVDNFGVDWLHLRPNQQDVVSPHSVELRALQQTGIVGTALLVTSVGAAVAAGFRTVVRGDAATRGTAVAAFLVFGYWAVHGSVDWLWEIPALSAVAFACLGLQVALSPSSKAATGRPWVLPTAISVVAAAAVVTLVPPWLSAREVEAALSVLPDGSGSAYAHLARARAWNPLADQPDVLGSVIAADGGDVTRQRAFLLRAVSRNPHNWYPYLELGVIDASRGHRAAGLTWLAQARALNPRDATLEFALERVRAGRPPTRAELDEKFVESAAACCTP